MKISGKLLAVVLVLALTSAFAQVRVLTTPGALTLNSQQETPTLTKFDLDFPGGTPGELVAAIQKAMGRPLNAVIPEEFGNVKLPPLKMDNVDVSQLFHALELASIKTEAVITGTAFDAMGNPRHTFQNHRTGHGFKTQGRASDDSVWYFSVDKPPQPPGADRSRICRFYSLAPYLERGLRLDDITTAIQTGWKMLDPQDSSSEISYHKETKLLIAVGEPDKLETIDAVLSALDVPKPAPGGPVWGGTRPVPHPESDE